MFANSCDSARLITERIISLETDGTERLLKYQFGAARQYDDLILTIEFPSILQSDYLIKMLNKVLIISHVTSLSLEGTTLELKLPGFTMIFFRKIPDEEIDSLSLLYSLGEEANTPSDDWKQLTIENWRELF
jgi:hypothetical protein